MGTDPYHPVLQNAEAMDLVEPMPHPEALPPDFVQAALVNGQLQVMGSIQPIQEPIPVFADMDATAMITSSHPSVSDAAANAAFLTPMDVVQQPPIPDNGLVAPNMPLSDPYSMITTVDSPMTLEVNPLAHPTAVPPTTHIPGLALVDPRMNTMLDPTLLPQMAPVNQIPINPVLPASAAPFINPTGSSLPHAVTPPQEEVTPQAAKASITTVKDILLDIQETAKHALLVLPDSEAVLAGPQVGQVGRAIGSIGHLNDCISQVTQKFSSLLTISSALESSSYTPPLQSPNILQEQKESPLSYASTSSTASSPMELPIESRKRSADELDDERRSVKSLKRESPENVPLSAHAEALDGAQAYPIAGISLHPNGSQTALPLGSHPTVSPSFSTRGFAPAPPLPPTPTYPSFNNISVAPSVESSSSSLSHASIAPPFPGIQTAWSDSVVPTRHHHSSSLDSMAAAQMQLATSDPVTPGIPDTIPSFLPQAASQPATPPNPAAMGVPIGRMSRSGSITSSFTPFTFGASVENTTEQGNIWANGLSRVPGQTTAQQSSPVWNNGMENGTSSLSPSPVSDRINLAAPAPIHRASPPTNDEDDDDDSDDEDGGQGRRSRQSDGSHGPSSANDVPAEYRAEVERIFFEFLNKICSNLDSTDSKGEPIHQTLMAKKMQRLDESPDFRPFKFRIQAFTHAFLEELAKHGFTDDKIPMKKVRNFLWRSPYILRFNEDGKKAKSKGNHIWNIEAKKVGEGKWEFRPFQRKLAGTPPSIAYCGLKWTWSPHIWDPQASLSNAPVEYSSPALPSWLSWNRNVLSGTPPPDAESCQITVHAKFAVDGQDCSLSHTFNLTIAPVKTMENQSIARSRRPSIVNEAPRRTASDSVLFQTVQRAKPRPAPSSADNRVIRVLQSVAQRVSEEAASQCVVPIPPKHQELVVLEKQKSVLNQSVNAFDKALSGTTAVEDRRLAVAAQNVVVQAAHSVLADRSIASGGVPIKHTEAVAVKNVTVSELSEATQDAIALAVKQEGPASSGVDIMVAATTILKLRTANNSSENLTVLASQPPPPRPFNGTAKRLSKIAAHPLSSVTEYAA